MLSSSNPNLKTTSVKAAWPTIHLIWRVPLDCRACTGAALAATTPNTVALP
ncbi:hypothetical protein GJ744_004918 [Endocarpon pusillum]|uniref:Uncharacterized protein n=1 Tax=Endocarpon pusillum TaxID=364733 RepID=A0A8H7ALP8_9EURO|nr:hypothetical protein GJ744_004918 [Endocarpon pusillum]